MLLKLMLIRAGLGWRTGLEILKLILLLIWGGVISLKRSRMFGGPCLTLGSSGIGS